MGSIIHQDCSYATAHEEEMSSTPNHCFHCIDGEMIKPFPIHTYDYNQEGWVPKYCTLCGICNDEEQIILINELLPRISNGIITKILKILCDREFNFPYSLFKHEKMVLQEIDFFNPFELINRLVDDLRLEYGFVSNVVYNNVSFYSFVS